MACPIVAQYYYVGFKNARLDLLGADFEADNPRESSVFSSEKLTGAHASVGAVLELEINSNLSLIRIVCVLMPCSDTPIIHFPMFIKNILRISTQ